MNNSIPDERILTVNQLIREIVESNQNGSRFCFILGSGASVESGIPTGSELEKRWMDFIMGEIDDGSGVKNTPKESRDLGRTLKNAKKLNYSFSSMEKAWRECKKDPNKRMPSKYYFDIYKMRFHPNKTNGYRYMERVMEHCTPSIGYHPLSLFLSRNNMNNLVITTNFDSLMEDALSIYSDKKPLIVGHESLTGFITTEVQRPIIAKVHRGLFYDPFNTPETTNHLSEDWKKALRSAFNIYTPIVIGYGGGDGSLMTFLEEKDTVMRHGIYWCYRENDDLDKRILELVEDKDGYFVPVKGFDALMLEIGKQVMDGSIHPASVEQYLRKQTEERIKQYNEQWTELNKKPELENIVESINQSEQKKEEQRETEGTLTYWDRIRRGSTAYEKQDYKTAILEFSEAEKMQSNNGDAYVWLGVVYHAMRDYNEAVRYYSKAIEQKPDYVLAYINRGNTNYVMERYDDAIRDYTKAIELKPDYASAYVNRGNAYQRIGKQIEALGEYTKAIEVDSNYAEAYVGRGNIYYEMGKYEESIKCHTKAIELKPDYVLAYNNRGNSYGKIDKNEEAIRDYTKAIELKPDYIDAYINRGIRYYNMRRYDETFKDFNKAIKIQPEYVITYIHRGNAYNNIRKYNDAIRDYTKALELKPDNREVYNYLGNTYYNLKQYDEALKNLNKAIELKPDYILAYENRARVYRGLGENELAEKDEETVWKLKGKK